MAFLYNQPTRRILLTLILLWGCFSFYTVNSASLVLLCLTGFLSLLSLIFIWSEISAIFLLIFISFLSAYSFFIALYQYNLPIYLVMLAVVVIFGYLFTYTEQKIGILGDKRLIYLVLFSLIILEIFMALSYFLISPISQSLIIATVSYLFIGFCYTILARHTDNRFITYVSLSVLIIAVVFATSSWGIVA